MLFSIYLQEEELKSLDDEQRHLKDACDQICEAPHYPTIPSAGAIIINQFSFLHLQWECRGHGDRARSS